MILTPSFRHTTRGIHINNSDMTITPFFFGWGDKISHNITIGWVSHKYYINNGGPYIRKGQGIFFFSFFLLPLSLFPWPRRFSQLSPALFPLSLLLSSLFLVITNKHLHLILSAPNINMLT
jgi:hypothetical protein